ncbi:MAG: TIGR01777 family oxidoreductase [Gordonia sp. (in: high G+C Gram-positive bacteria)]|uniref:TIGR01777 family oxidoreductase n=1 Tax=Gordonia sp. (in: high G+C Gram-positive bacteria) TaxID=84139 RepID=UPI003BB67396
MGIVHSSTVDATCDEVFAWHSRPGALHRLLPPWQPMSAISESPSLADGQAMLGLPGGLRWRAQHRADEFDPPHRFVDERITDGARELPAVLSGPWRHEHEFAAEPGGQTTRMTDRVHTAVPAVALRSTFAFRHRQVADDLARHRQAREAGLVPLTIAVTGASGMVGQQLTAFLTTGGHRVIRLVRARTDAADERTWDPHVPAADLLNGVDAVIHLAGAPIAGRFTDAHKAQVRDSRVGPTRRLTEVAAAAADGPSVFVSASAIGYYGHNQPGKTLTETDPPGDDFLAAVVRDWEGAAAADAAGLRCVQVRTGIVQSPLGGVLRVQRPLFAAGLGGRLGSGRQVLSWIDLDDLIDVYHRALYDDRLTGPVNATSPEPVTGSQYANTLGQVLHRPTLLPVPALGPSLILGRQGARELALADQHVQPSALLQINHRFRRPALRTSLRHQLGKA